MNNESVSRTINAYLEKMREAGATDMQIGVACAAHVFLAIHDAAGGIDAGAAMLGDAYRTQITQLLLTRAAGASVRAAAPPPQDMANVMQGRAPNDDGADYAAMPGDGDDNGPYTDE